MPSPLLRKRSVGAAKCNHNSIAAILAASTAPRDEVIAMRTRFAMLAIAVALVADGSSALGQDATLRYKWVKGDQVRYRTTQRSSTTMSGVPGLGELTIDQTLVQVVRMAVEDVAADGGITLRQTFESVRLEQSSPTGTIVFDSTVASTPADQGAAVMATMMSAMIGESVTIEIAPSGRVNTVQGMSRILEKAMKTLPASPATTLAFNQIKGSMSDDVVRGLVEQGFATFSDRQVKAGDTWTSQSELINPILGKVTAARTFTLTSLDSRDGTSVARLAVTIAIKQVEPSTAGPLGIGAKVGDSESAGEIVFDITKGRVQQTSFKSETPLNMSLPQPGADPIDIKGLSRTALTMEIVGN